MTTSYFQPKLLILILIVHRNKYPNYNSKEIFKLHNDKVYLDIPKQHF